VTALTTTTLAMFCSVLFSRTSVSIMTSYVVLLLLYAAPVVAWVFAQEFSPSIRVGPVSTHFAAGRDSPSAWLQWSTSTSPMAAAFSLPLTLGDSENHAPGAGFWWQHAATAFIAFYVLLDTFLLGAMLWLFHRRWRVWS